MGELYPGARADAAFQAFLPTSVLRTSTPTLRRLATSS